MYALKTTRQIGSEIENLALDFLEKKGLKLFKQNFHSRLGEIDLVFTDKDSLVFVEVRFRKNNFFGGPLASITPQKQRKLKFAALYFLKLHPAFSQSACRFDVVSVTTQGNKPEIQWIQNAF